MQLKILTLLSDGNYCSGRELGETLGITRAAIWKHIKQLQQQGLPVVSHRGKGYCWVGGGDLLSVDNIINGSPIPEELVRVYPDVASTNKVALGGVLEGRPSGFTVFAEQQSAGRGRRGRVWASPVAQNLYFSTIFRAGGGVQALQGLSLAVGIVIAEVINDCYDVNCKVKWPNDLLVSGKKLGGILVELAGDASGDCAAVIGIGLNCNMKPSAQDIDQPWTSLVLECGATVSRNTLAAKLLDRLQLDLAVFLSEGFAAFKSRWKKLDVLAGEQLLISGPKHLDAGVGCGVDDLGGLRVLSPLGEKVFYGGEVSVRLS